MHDRADILRGFIIPSWVDNCRDHEQVMRHVRKGARENCRVSSGVEVTPVETRETIAPRNRSHYCSITFVGQQH
jgi:hypothetical protein